MLQPRIIKVEPRNGHCLHLEYETGEKKIFDVSPYINGSWYGELENPEYFNGVSVLPGGVGIEWEHGQDIAPHELYEMSMVE